MTPVHHLTVDVEEFFHGTAFEQHIPRDSWAEWPRRAPGVMDRLLELLDVHQTRATFFIVGWLAEREPEMVRRCARAGRMILAW